MRKTKCFCGGPLLKEGIGDYHRCSSCQSWVCLAEPPQFEDYYSFEDYWHKHQNDLGFPSIEERAKEDFDNRIPFWYELLPEGTTSILEIGCAHGGFLKYCKDRGVPIVLGMEPSDKTCQYARRTFGISMLCGIFPEVFPNFRFDVVCAFDVMEHCPDPIKFLATMKKISKTMMIQVPSDGEQHMKSQEHLYLFSKPGLYWLAEKAGVSVKIMKPGAFVGDIIFVGE